MAQETLWSGVSDNLKHQIAVNGEAICHSHVIGQVLIERIVGTPDEKKYAAALEIFAKELAATWKAVQGENGPIFVFTPLTPVTKTVTMS